MSLDWIYVEPSNGLFRCRSAMTWSGSIARCGHILPGERDHGGVADGKAKRKTRWVNFRIQIKQDSHVSGGTYFPAYLVARPMACLIIPEAGSCSVGG
jgi:hypothetical protein